tara:strand:- start:1213 stop:1407 length:195 start_codon:yes stop_codon:yes gene_type:complete
VEIRFGVYLHQQRGVEQLVARRAHNPKVVGSSPAPATKNDSSVFFIGESFFEPMYPLLLYLNDE